MFFHKRKNIVFCIATFLFTAIYIQDARSQAHVPVYRELIIELPGLSAEKQLNEIVFSLASLGGIHYEGYCSQMKCLLLNVDGNIHPDNGAIMNKLKEKADTFIIKPTGKIHQVIENCKDPIIPNNEAQEISPDMR